MKYYLALGLVVWHCTGAIAAAQNFIGRWQVKFPTTAPATALEVAITAEGKVYFIDTEKKEAIEIFTLTNKLSDQPTIPAEITIVDLAARAKAEAIARRSQIEARTVLNTIHQAQVQYFAQNQKLSPKLEKLGFGSQINSEIFTYTIAEIIPDLIVQVIATTKTANPSTFIGISYLQTTANNQKVVTALICQGNNPNPKPRFIQVPNRISDVKCPTGFQAL